MHVICTPRSFALRGRSAEFYCGGFKLLRSALFRGRRHLLTVHVNWSSVVALATLSAVELSQNEKILRRQQQREHHILWPSINMNVTTPRLLNTFSKDEKYKKRKNKLAFVCLRFIRSNFLLVGTYEHFGFSPEGERDSETNRVSSFH